MVHVRDLTGKELVARSRVALAVDVPSAKQAIEYVENLYDLVGLYKIGMELFTAEGPQVIKAIQERGGSVFLDLKYLDIPNTVYGASRAATRHGVKMFNVHSSGGHDMMKAAREGAIDATSKYGVGMPQIIGVTVLTSFDEARYLQVYKPLLSPELRNVDFSKYNDVDKKEEVLQEEFNKLKKQFGLEKVVERQVLHLAKLTEGSNLEGIVCSPAELRAVRGSNELPKEFTYTTPSIQARSGHVGADQKRPFTADRAIEEGSTTLVVGRAITDPKGTKNATPDEMRQAAYEILHDMASKM